MTTKTPHPQAEILRAIADDENVALEFRWSEKIKEHPYLSKEWRQTSGEGFFDYLSNVSSGYMEIRIKGMSTEKDRELLELAAKAAGLRVKWEEVHTCHWIELSQGLAIKPWNPLHDDGDALRLAVKLGLSVGHYQKAVRVWTTDGQEVCVGESYQDDRDAATRLAIVRAAAEIGKAME